jgi:ribosomal protein S27AE
MTPRSVRVYLGGSESKTQEVKPYCPDCGHVICAENLDLVSQLGECDQCGLEFPLAKSPIMAYSEATWPDFARLSYEKEDGWLRIDWHREGFFSMIINSLLLIFTLFFLYWMAEFKWEKFLPATIFIPIVLLPGLLRLLTRWTIDFDMKKLEISYNCLFFRGKQTMLRKEIAAFSLHEKPERWIVTLNSWLCPQSAVIAEHKNGRGSRRTPALRMPGFTQLPSRAQSVWLLNELNDFLASKGRSNDK